MNNMKHIETAQNLYTTAYQRWALELSHDKNITIAKDIAKYVCEHSASSGGKKYWEEVQRLIGESNHTELYKP
jgi:predicted secreted protein